MPAIPIRGNDPSTYTLEKAVKSAEKLARTQHLLSLKCETQQEKLAHKLHVELGLMKDGARGRVILRTGRDLVPEGSYVYIHLHNLDQESKIFVSVFDLQIDGKISLVSSLSLTGIELVPNDHYTIEKYGGKSNGLAVQWPNGVPKLQPVEETLILVISNESADLQYLETPEGQKNAVGRTVSQRSKLESVFHSLAYGDSKKIGS